MTARSKERRDERRKDLLADRATVGLDEGEAKELARLEAGAGGEGAADSGMDESYELAAAAAHLAMLEESEKLPELLEQRLKSDARAFFAGRDSAAQTGPVKRSRWPVAGAAVFLAAAAVLIVWLAQRPAESEPQQALAAAEQRSQLVGRAGDLLTLPWQATEDATATGASGDVVWSDAEQTGFMRIRGLAVNDPGIFQYQLWIFDPARDERYPVDGGVFDIAPGADEVIVAMQPKLAVRGPTLFAVTIEPPGGVVVSSRERIALLAQAP